MFLFQKAYKQMHTFNGNVYRLRKYIHASFSPLQF